MPTESPGTKPERRQSLLESADPFERPFVLLHLAYLNHPWRIYGAFLVLCGVALASSYETIKASGELFAALVFFMGFAPVFFFFSMKWMLWMMLRIRGIPAGYLRNDADPGGS